MSIQNPFVSGARVAVQVDRGWSAPISYKEAFVDKTFKTGRFTLRGSKQQWRPHEPAQQYQTYWHARETGDYGRNQLRIWDDAADAEINAVNEARRRFDKFRDLQQKIERLSFSDLVTDEVVDWMQCVVLAAKPVAQS